MNKAIEVTKENPCSHCGKPDWCYRLESLSVCNRDASPAQGWYKTSKTDQNGHYYYAPSVEKKSPRPKQKRIWEYPDRNGNPLVRVIRIDDGNGGQPKRWQERWDGQKWVKGRAGIKRENIPIYRFREIREAIGEGKTIFIVEGEPCADALWKLGLPATTNIGGSQKWKPSDTSDLKNAEAIVLSPDRDVPGVQHMEMISKDLKNGNISLTIKWLYAFPSSSLWNNLPTNGGLDVVDWIEEHHLTPSDIINSVECYRVLKYENQSHPNTSKSDSHSTNHFTSFTGTHYTQMCIDELYSDKPWITIEGQLYEWNGKYYQKANHALERRRITEWCNTTPVKVGKGWKYAYATPTHVDNIWRWLLSSSSVSTENINPPGINCLNGVVKINWSGKNVSWELVPHDSKVMYTYISELEFDKDADSTECDRLLSCLEPHEQKLFLQTIAASLDLKTIRKYRGREVRALLCKGHGNNGKDTLREAVRMLFGHTVTNATVSDFAAYDSGRKFSLAKLERALINWSSENSSFNNLDRLQSLKAAITGEPLDMERKGVDEHEMMLNSVFLFNINESPNLKAAMEAIQSRWAVLSFNKTYKQNADPNKGEIEADSRFRYDPNFLSEKVCPALLNKLLNALSTIISEGIDYSCTEEAIKNIQEETNHLWAFAREVGLDYQTGSRVYINDLWELLFKWYVSNGTLEIISENGKEKKVWHDQPKRRDKNVKAPNQIYQRFSELFPKIKKERDTSSRNLRTGQFYLSGVGIKKTEAIIEATKVSTEASTEANTEANTEARKVTQKATEATEAIKPTLDEILNKTQNLSLEQKNQLISRLLSDKEFASLIPIQVSSKNSQTDNFIAENLAEGEKIASVASVPYKEDVPASAIASVIASVEESTASVNESTDQITESKKDCFPNHQPIKAEKTDPLPTFSLSSSQGEKAEIKVVNADLLPYFNCINQRVQSTVTKKRGTVKGLSLGSNLVFLHVQFDEETGNVPCEVQKLVNEQGQPLVEVHPVVEKQPLIPKPEATELDWTTYPHLTSTDERAAKNNAAKVKEGLLSAGDRLELEALKQQFSQEELNWVYSYLLSDNQRQQVKDVGKRKQLDLFSSTSSIITE